MYSAHNKGKSVVTEKFIRTLENKVYKHMTLISKNAYIDKFNGKIIKYNNTYSTTKTKPVDVKSSTYIDFDEKNKKEDQKFKAGNHVRILIYKNIFVRGNVLSWSEKVKES